MSWSGRTKRHGRHLKKSVDSATPRPPDFGSRACRLRRKPASSESKRAQRFRVFASTPQSAIDTNSHARRPPVSVRYCARFSRCVRNLGAGLFGLPLSCFTPGRPFRLFCFALRGVPLSKGDELNRLFRSKSCCLLKFTLPLRRRDHLPVPKSYGPTKSAHLSRITVAEAGF